MQNITHFCKKEDPFSRVPWDLLNDRNLSAAEKGILAYLTGKPLNWKTRFADLVNHFADSEYNLRKYMEGLRIKGYAALVSTRSQGKIIDWDYKIADSPVFLDKAYLLEAQADGELAKLEKSRLEKSTKAANSKPDHKLSHLVKSDVEPSDVINREHSKNHSVERKKGSNNNKAADAAGGADGEHSLSGADAPEEKELNDGTCFMARWSQCFQQWFGAPYLQKPGEAVQANKLIKTLDCRPKDLLAYALRMWINTSEADFVNAGQYDPLFYQIKGSRSARFFLNNLSDIAEEQEHPLDCALRVSEPDFQELEALVKVGRPEAC